MSLKQKTISNIKWSFIESMSLKAITFLLGIILARLLLPEDFGLLAIVNVFYLLVTLFVEGGLKEALIQKKDATEVHYSTVFWLNIIVSVLLYLLLFFSAPWIERFYGYEHLAFYIRLQSLTLIIESFGLVQVAKAIKELNLRKITKARIPASLISFGVGIFLAFHGYGIHSLIIQQLINTSLYVVFLVVSIRYKPKFLINLDEAKTLYSFGLKILGIALISRFYAQSLNLIYAKFYSPALLGLNNKATTIQNAPIEIINTSFMKGVYPTLVVLQDNTEKLKELYLTNVTLLTYLMLFLNGILFFEAAEIIEVLLGKNWAESAIYLQIISIGSLLAPITVQSQNVCKVRNILNSFLKLELFNKGLTLTVLLILIHSLSFPALLMFVFGINVLFSLVYFLIVSKNLEFAFSKEIGLVFLRILIFGTMGWGLNYISEYWIENQNILRIICFSASYGIIALFVFWLLDKKTFYYLKEKIK